ncbi:SMI1/KNR4 family protein [Tenacibaculum halocynthiae]|uniref:SMI1/KNR4 family protein n=1 Tax=Tenacibaculum halocynthiae TaxID=1254437 RepID=UPI0038945D1C
MDKLNQIERIKVKLRLAKNTDSFFEVFGASSHKYTLNSPLDVQEINDFEKTYKITLPDTYKTFLSKIGNGGIEYKNSVVGNSGAGPDYGIFKLGHLHHFIVEPSLKYLEKEPFFNESTTQEEWDKIYDEMDDNISDEDYDKEVAKAYSGILNIGFSGCSGYLGIILNGKNKERVVHTYDEIEYCPHFSEEINFLDWYENWLDDIISGKSIMRMDVNIGELTEEYIVNEFISDIDDDYWKFKRLGTLRSFKTLSKNSINKLKEKYKNIKHIDQKICLLNFLTKYDYEKSKEEIAKLSKDYPMAFLRNIHLYNKDKSNEWLNEINRIRESENSELLEYIEFVTDTDIKTTANKELW